MKDDKYFAGETLELPVCASLYTTGKGECSPQVPLPARGHEGGLPSVEAGVVHCGVRSITQDLRSQKRKKHEIQEGRANEGQRLLCHSFVIGKISWLHQERPILGETAAHVGNEQRKEGLKGGGVNGITSQQETDVFWKMQHEPYEVLALTRPPRAASESPALCSFCY